MNRPVVTDFAWTVTAAAPPPLESDHVGGMQLAEVLYDASMQYLVAALGVADLQALARLTSCRPILSGVSSTFVSALGGGEPIRIGVKAGTRTSRSFVLDDAVWAADRLVAFGTTSIVMFDTDAGRATDIPAELWDRMTAMDAR